jgi:hypothetical protein
LILGKHKKLQWANWKARSVDSDAVMDAPEDLFAQLSPEILFHIYDYLLLKDILLICRVSRDWNELLSSDALWRTRFPKKFNIGNGQRDARPISLKRRYIVSS